MGESTDTAIVRSNTSGATATSSSPKPVIWPFVRATSTSQPVRSTPRRMAIGVDGRQDEVGAVGPHALDRRVDRGVGRDGVGGQLRPLDLGRHGDPGVVEQGPDVLDHVALELVGVRVEAHLAAVEVSGVDHLLHGGERVAGEVELDGEEPTLRTLLDLRCLPERTDVRLAVELGDAQGLVGEQRPGHDEDLFVLQQLGTDPVGVVGLGGQEGAGHDAEVAVGHPAPGVGPLGHRLEEVLHRIDADVDAELVEDLLGVDPGHADRDLGVGHPLARHRRRAGRGWPRVP